MTVFVDEPIWPYRGMLMCHMVAADVEELHALAAKIGLQRRWFQDPRSMPRVSIPHYDVAKSKRAQAIAAGAVAIDRYQMSAISKVALFRLHGKPDDFRDPLAVLRGREGRPGHPELARVEAWLAEVLQ